MGDKKTEYVLGTDRPRTDLDDWLDQYILDEHYKKTGEKRTPERDVEILELTYIKPLK